MATGDEQQAIKTLNRLVRLCNASEKGFNVAAENVRNRGLKVMFKTYAKERAQNAQSLGEQVRELGDVPAEGGGVLAAAHRGWINIKAAMTIGQVSTEKVVLGEVVRGERVAVRNYEDALHRTLPAEMRALVEEQYERVREVSNRARDLQGQEGERLVVRLFDSEEDVAEAESDLHAAGFDPERMERVPLEEMMSLYEGRRVADTVTESGLAGALAGAGLGVILGLVAAVSAILAPGEPMFAMSVGELFVWTLLLGAGAGLLFGALIGAIIGLGVSQEDEYRYAESVERGSILLMVRTDLTRADEASKIMRGVNARRWPLAAEA
jgi:uncharacterized protein (TIGR02284 family)